MKVTAKQYRKMKNTLNESNNDIADTKICLQNNPEIREKLKSSITRQSSKYQLDFYKILLSDKEQFDLWTFILGENYMHALQELKERDDYTRQRLGRSLLGESVKEGKKTRLDEERHVNSFTRASKQYSIQFDKETYRMINDIDKLVNEAREKQTNTENEYKKQIIDKLESIIPLGKGIKFTNYYGPLGIFRNHDEMDDTMNYYSDQIDIISMYHSNKGIMLKTSDNKELPLIDRDYDSFIGCIKDIFENYIYEGHVIQGISMEYDINL